MTINELTPGAPTATSESASTAARATSTPKASATPRSKRLKRLQNILGMVIVLLAAALAVGLVVNHAPLPLYQLTITVIGEGDTQADVDACKGPVLWEGTIIVEHNKCGGWAWLGLQVGATVTLKGDAIKPGTYTVAAIKKIRTGDAIAWSPYPYAVQTCVDDKGNARLWYLQPV